jgi:hypothetical protein
VIRRLVLLGVTASASLLGQYVYDAVPNYNPGEGPWQWNTDQYGNQWPTANTSVIYTGTFQAPGANLNDYEVMSRLPGASGNTVHFLCRHGLCSLCLLAAG